MECKHGALKKRTWKSLLPIFRRHGNLIIPPNSHVVSPKLRVYLFRVGVDLGVEAHPIMKVMGQLLDRANLPFGGLFKGGLSEAPLDTSLGTRLGTHPGFGV